MPRHETRSPRATAAAAGRRRARLEARCQRAARLRAWQPRASSSAMARASSVTCSTRRRSRGCARASSEPAERSAAPSRTARRAPAASSRTSAPGPTWRPTRRSSAARGWARPPRSSWAREVRLFHDHMLVKEPGTTIRTPWHQDQPFYCIDGSQTISFWIPLDPVSRRHAWSSSPARTRGTWFMPRVVLRRERARVRRGHARGGARRRGRSRRVHDPRLGDAAGRRGRVQHADAARGRGPRRRRRAVSFRLIGDDVRFAVRPHPTSPAFPSSRACWRRATRSSTRSFRGCGRATPAEPALRARGRSCRACGGARARA